MKLKHTHIFLLLLAAITFTLLLEVEIKTAFAADAYSDSILEEISEITDSATEKLLKFARSLFIGLATLSLAFGLSKSLLYGESNLGAVASQLAKWMIYVGIFMWIMSSGDHIFFIPKVIVNSFMQAGTSLATSKGYVSDTISPSSLFELGATVYAQIADQTVASGIDSIPAFIAIALVDFCILLIAAMLAGTMLVTMIEMHLVICGGSILIGFAGFEYTRDIAFSYLKYAVSVGVKILMLMVVYVVAAGLINKWVIKISAAENLVELLSKAAQILCGMVCLFMTARTVPNYATSIITGASGNLGFEGLTSTGSGMKNAVFGQRTAGGERIGGLLGAGQAIGNVIKNARTTQTAAFRGMANTMDAAKAGGIKGALGHIGTATPGVRRLMQASEGGKGNILRYAKASALYGSQSERATRFLEASRKPEMSPGNSGGLNTPEQVAERMRKG